MAKKKIRTGKVDIPAEEFRDENVTAHISIRIPLPILNGLQRAALTEKYAGRYQVLIRDILSDWLANRKTKRKRN